MERLCIYPKEVASILHIGERQAQRILKTIRKDLNKKKLQAITVKEFSEHQGFEVTNVLKALQRPTI